MHGVGWRRGEGRVKYAGRSNIDILASTSDSLGLEEPVASPLGTGKNKGDPVKRSTLIPALENGPRSPGLRGSSGTAVNHRAREREGRALLDEHRQQILDQAWKEAEETKEDEEAGMDTPEGGSGPMDVENLVMRFYGSGWDDTGDYLGEGKAYRGAASRRARLRAEEEEWQRAVGQVTAQVGGLPRHPSGLKGKWQKRLERLAEVGAALEVQLKAEQAERVALEEAFVGIGLDLPDLQGLWVGMEEQEESREVARLEVQVQWLSQEGKAVCLHLHLLQLRALNELRGSSRPDLRAAQQAEELQMLKAHLEGQLEYTQLELELECLLNKQLESAIANGMDGVALASLLGEGGSEVAERPPSDLVRRTTRGSGIAQEETGGRRHSMGGGRDGANKTPTRLSPNHLAPGGESSSSSSSWGGWGARQHLPKREAQTEVWDTAKAERAYQSAVQSQAKGRRKAWMRGEGIPTPSPPSRLSIFDKIKRAPKPHVQLPNLQLTAEGIPSPTVPDLRSTPCQLSEELLKSVLSVYMNQALGPISPHIASSSPSLSPSTLNHRSPYFSLDPSQPSTPHRDLSGSPQDSDRTTPTVLLDDSWHERGSEAPGGRRSTNLPFSTASTPEVHRAAWQSRDGGIIAPEPQASSWDDRTPPLAQYAPPSLPSRKSLDSHLADRGSVDLREVEAALEDIVVNPRRMGGGAGDGGGSDNPSSASMGLKRSVPSILPPRSTLDLAEDLFPSECQGGEEGQAMDEGHPDPYGMMGDHPCPDVGEYALALEVTSLPGEEERSCRDAFNLARFRKLAGQLEEVQPGRLSEDQKLAFWINLHNALLMHAYLSSGIPRNHMGRISMMSKVSFLVKGYPMSALTIEHSILRSVSHRPPLAKHLPISVIHATEERVLWKLKKGEPLLRVYTAANICSELAVAKNEYLRAAVGISRNDVVLLPKVLDWYGRDFGPNVHALLVWVADQLPPHQTAAVTKRINVLQPNKGVNVVPFEWAFRYLLQMREVEGA